MPKQRFATISASNSQLNTRSLGLKDISYLRDLYKHPNLISKLHSKAKSASMRSTTDPACLITSIGAKSENHPRVCIEKADHQRLLQASPNLPYKIQASHLALLEAERPLPEEMPCIPSGLQSKISWVASHLCHNSRCIDPTHLVWEPDWYNRSRDNCLREVECPKCSCRFPVCSHEPPCLKAHKPYLARQPKNR